MRDRIASIGPIAAMAGAVGLCCGLPILLSVGVAGAIAGWSMPSWVLIGLGLVLAAAGWARWSRGRRHDQADQACHCPTSNASGDTSPEDIADSTTTDVTANGKIV